MARQALVAESQRDAEASRDVLGPRPRELGLGPFVTRGLERQAYDKLGRALLRKDAGEVSNVGFHVARPADRRERHCARIEVADREADPPLAEVDTENACHGLVPPEALGTDVGGSGPTSS
jgi:hypothetical protein